MLHIHYIYTHMYVHMYLHAYLNVVPFHICICICHDGPMFPMFGCSIIDFQMILVVI